MVIPWLIFFFVASACCPDIVFDIIRKNSILVTFGSERVKYPVISILCSSKKQNSKLIYLTIYIYLCWTEHLLKVKPIHKCVLVLNLLTPASDYIYFLLTISPLNHTLPSQEQRKWSQTKEALDCWTNSPCQYVRKCIENRTENMHGDVGV